MIKYPFKVYQTEKEGHIFWVAKSTSLKGCVGQGDLMADAIAELEENEKAWLETAEEVGIPIPEIMIEKTENYRISTGTITEIAIIDIFLSKCYVYLFSTKCTRNKN